MKQIRERLTKKLKDFMSCYANVENFRLKHIFKIIIAKESQRSYNEMATNWQQKISKPK